MTYDPDKHHRRSIRLKWYDYAQAGAYFVTICTHERQCLFGEVVDGAMRLNEYGVIVEQCWLDIPRHFPHVKLDLFVVMPNHVHGIVVVTSTDIVGARHAVPLPRTEQFGKPVSGSIPTVIRSFKSATTKRINERRGTPGWPVWQRNYYEHVIRDEPSLNRIRQYILDNPLRWAMDRENPNAVEAEPEEAWRA